MAAVRQRGAADRICPGWRIPAYSGPGQRAARFRGAGSLAVLILVLILAGRPPAAAAAADTDTAPANRAAAASASDAAEVPVAMDPASDPALTPEERLNALSLRILGMEGKLRESALARKTAEQARMESERRLAESIREVERLHAEVERLGAARADLEQRLNDRDAERARLESELLSRTTERDTLASRLTSLQTRLPLSEGGILSVEDARSAAAEALASLRALTPRPGTATGGAEEQARQTALANLNRRQLLVARATDALGLYRVRPNDSLALISQRFHGTSNQWRAIYEANRHLLDDPDQLIPGMTLVIP